MKIKDKLTFSEPSGNVPEMVCHTCGQKKVPKYIATIHPFADSSCDMSIVTCSDECKSGLLEMDDEILAYAILCMACDISYEMAEPFNEEWTGYVDEFADKDERKCRVCGCTDTNCSQCIEKTGHPCHWVEEDLCSACVPAEEKSAILLPGKDF